MTALETLVNFNHNGIKFLATDIDLEVLEKAAEGIYTEHEMRGVPSAYRHKYFERLKQEDSWRFKPELQGLVRFAQLNLLATPFPFEHKFDFIFCRNVLIYFDRATTSSVISNLAASLQPGGILVLGHSESGVMKLPGFKTIAHAVYQKHIGPGSK
jgi:chemotaxis protein methyltransferase CheR